MVAEETAYLFFLVTQTLVAVVTCELQLFTNHYVAEVEGGEREARALAQHYDLRLMETTLFPNFYHFMDNRQPKVRHQPSWRLTRTIKGHRKVKYVEQQVLTPRLLRDYRVQKYGFQISADFNDPYYDRLWYLHGRGLLKAGKGAAQNINVEPVWNRHITGRGVVLFVLDDGLQSQNKDIASNYESINDWDVSDINHPLPTAAPKKSEDFHGTYCAATIAGVANNSFCGVGVAFNSKIGGIRVLGKKILTDMQESMALRLWLSNGDVASASWGPKDNGKTVEGPKRLAAKALHIAITEGRAGKGAILVWAAGNGGIYGDNANMDGYASSIYTITIGALSYDGSSCLYSEPGASVMASIPVSGFSLGAIGISVVVPNLDGTCRENFQGTSAAAPIAAGVVALMLEANPELTWRDVQHLIVLTAKTSGNRDTILRNGAGLRYSLKQGFGCLDADLIVHAAEHWKNVPPQRTEIYGTNFVERSIRLPHGNTTFFIRVPESKIGSLEHVVLYLTIEHNYRGALEIFLTSPSGTVSQVLTKRAFDDSKKGFASWPFMSVHFWNEKPEGVWTVTVGNSAHSSGQLTNAKLRLYGH
ncbi:neuroendocrine convertase 1-like [Cloeon dipterum]|uniref:neuroendocrine convertase 1-like n=1 Tax=Cloeon dipterum TaxID=197152 RepID=UPI00321FE930